MQLCWLVKVYNCNVVILICCSFIRNSNTLIKVRTQGMCDEIIPAEFKERSSQQEKSQQSASFSISVVVLQIIK